MPSAFPKPPICEICRKDPAISFSHFPPGSKGNAQGWLFTCMCTADTEDYYIKFDSIFSSPASTVDWLAHMHEKSWMNWPNFMDMVDRFREATQSYHQI
jgi:hypothetical protein